MSLLQTQLGLKQPLSGEATVSPAPMLTNTLRQSYLL